MSTGMNRREWMKWSGTAMALSALPAWAQTTWPTKAIVMVVPFPAGGGTDAFARPLSAGWTAQLGKQIIIDNRGGAGGNLGAGVAAKAAGDGYTLFMGGVHHSIAPSMYPKLDYDLQKDFIPLALVVRVPQVLVVNDKNHRPGLLLSRLQRVLVKTKTFQLIEMRRRLAWRIAGNGLG